VFDRFFLTGAVSFFPTSREPELLNFGAFNRIHRSKRRRAFGSIQKFSSKEKKRLTIPFPHYHGGWEFGLRLYMDTILSQHGSDPRDPRPPWDDFGVGLLVAWLSCLCARKASNGKRKGNNTKPNKREGSQPEMSLVRHQRLKKPAYSAPWQRPPMLHAGLASLFGGSPLNTSSR